MSISKKYWIKWLSSSSWGYFHYWKMVKEYRLYHSWKSSSLKMSNAPKRIWWDIQKKFWILQLELDSLNSGLWKLFSYFNHPALRITARARNKIRQVQVALFNVDSALLALVNIELPLDARPPIPSPFGLWRRTNRIRKTPEIAHAQDKRGMIIIYFSSGLRNEIWLFRQINRFNKGWTSHSFRFW